MMNWMWVIPWVIVILFYAGWHFGGKTATKKELERRYREDAERCEEWNTSRAISELYRHLDELDGKIERIFCTKEKEEKTNG